MRNFVIQINMHPMKFIHFLFFPAVLVFAMACGQDASKPQGDPQGATDPGTAEASDPGNPAYTITVLNGDLPSPRKEMSGAIDSIDIVVNYGSPSVRGRTIWGGLIPYDKVWRTGANEATAVSFSKNVRIEGKDLAAGRYGLFTIPGKNTWTVIFNSVPDQWGDFEYDDTKDVLRVEVSPKSASDNQEQMDFTIEGNAIVLRWEKLAVPISVAAPE